MVTKQLSIALESDFQGGHLATLQRTMVLKAACGLGMAGCTSFAKAKFDSREFQDPDLQEVVLHFNSFH